MKIEGFIPLSQLCEYYTIEMSFFIDLRDNGLIEINNIEEIYYIHEDKLSDLEKMIRFHDELDINMEGIDTIFNLLGKIDQLQSELMELRNRLRLYENDNRDNFE